MDKIFVTANESYVGKLYMLIYKDDDYIQLIDQLKDSCKDIIAYKVTNNVYGIICIFNKAKRFSKTFRTI